MSAIYVDSIKDKSNTKTLATLSSSAVTLDSSIVFPAGHIVDEKISIFSADADDDISTTATSWAGTSSHLNVTIALKNSSNMLIFTVFTSRTYLSASANFFLMGVGFSNALGTNIIDLSSESPSSTQHANGKFASLYSISAPAPVQTTWSATFKYMPGTTVSKTYQPIWYSSGSGDCQLVTANDGAWASFHVREIQQ